MMPRLFFFLLTMLWAATPHARAESLEGRFRNMVKEVKAAIEDTKHPKLKVVEEIIQRECNMDTICAYVSASYIKPKVSGMDAAAKKSFISDFLATFKPVYTAYLARTWTSENTAKTFKEYELKDCLITGKRVEMKFERPSKEISYIVLELDDKSLIRSVKFGEKQNLVDPISADRGSCESGVSQGKEPKDIFSGNKVNDSLT